MKTIICILAMFLSFIPASVFSATYFVSPTGNDSASGTSEAPWKTLGFASKQLRAGDTLIIRVGEYRMQEYFTDMITLEESGTHDKWITIKGEAIYNRPVIKGSNNLFAAIDISGKNYVRIENLEITSLLDNPYSGGLREGIDAGGSGGGDVSHIEIRNILIHHVEETGINVSGNADHLRFEGVHIHHTGMTSLGCPSANGGAGWQNVVIYRCKFEYAGMFYQGKEEMSPYDRPDGFGIEDSEGPIEIAYTTSQYNFGDGLDSKSKRTHIHHCMVANNFGDGVKIWGSGSKVENTLIFGTGYPRPTLQTPWTLLIIESDDENGDFEIINNTLFDDSSRPPHYSMVVQYDNCPTTPINLTMRNNIIAGLKRAYIGGCVNLTAQNNIFYNRMENEGVQLQYGNRLYTDVNIASLGSGNIYSNPLFKNGTWGAEADFHLTSGSPAIDAGENGIGRTDYEFEPRIVGAKVDIGADEFRPAPAIESKVVVNGNHAQGVGDGDYFAINLFLDPHGSSEIGECYLWVDIPGYGIFWYQYPSQWFASDSPLLLYKGPIFLVSNLKIFDAMMYGLPTGKYYLYFGVDTTLDGQIDWNSVSIAEMDVFNR